eukprot:scaffold12965_cov241-Isochrysis_galbana.AAC.6
MKSLGLRNPCLESSTFANAARSRSDEPAATATSSAWIMSSRDDRHATVQPPSARGTVGDGCTGCSATTLCGCVSIDPPPARSAIPKRRVLSAKARMDVDDGSTATTHLALRMDSSLAGVSADGESCPGFLSTRCGCPCPLV